MGLTFGKEDAILIYITGDTHGRFDRIIRFCERVKPTASDTMIILGDAGFNYYGDWRDRQNKEMVSRLPLTIFSIHGNHEERPNNIPSYKTVEWHGGLSPYAGFVSDSTAC